MGARSGCWSILLQVDLGHRRVLQYVRKLYQCDETTYSCSLVCVTSISSSPAIYYMHFMVALIFRCHSLLLWAPIFFQLGTFDVFYYSCQQVAWLSHQIYLFLLIFWPRIMEKRVKLTCTDPWFEECTKANGHCCCYRYARSVSVWGINPSSSVRPLPSIWDETNDLLIRILDHSCVL